MKSSRTHCSVILERGILNLHRKSDPEYIMARARLNPIAFFKGSIATGILPPILFMINKVTVTAVALTFLGTSSTRIANITPNHMPAV